MLHAIISMAIYDLMCLYAFDVLEDVWCCINFCTYFPMRNGNGFNKFRVWWLYLANNILSEVQMGFRDGDGCWTRRVRGKYETRTNIDTVRWGIWLRIHSIPVTSHTVLHLSFCLPLCSCLFHTICHNEGGCSAGLESMLLLHYQTTGCVGYWIDSVCMFTIYVKLHLMYSIFNESIRIIYTYTWYEAFRVWSMCVSLFGLFAIQWERLARSQVLLSSPHKTMSR